MIITDSRVPKWVKTHTGLTLGKTAVGIGEERDGKIIAGVTFDCWTKNNIFVSMAVGGKTSKEFWEVVAKYPFEQLGCTRVTAIVESSNMKSIKLTLHGGFTEECRLVGAASDGSDLIMYKMHKDDCRVLDWDKTVLNRKSGS